MCLRLGQELLASNAEGQLAHDEQHNHHHQQLASYEHMPDLCSACHFCSRWGRHQPLILLILLKLLPSYVTSCDSTILPRFVHNNGCLQENRVRCLRQHRRPWG